MAANINDKFTEATNGSRPVPTTLTATRAVGAASISCGALTGWPTATAVHFIIYTIDVNGRKVAGTQTDWKGIVSGSTIGSLVLKAGTDNGDVIGAVVEAAPTAAWADDVTEGLVVSLNQDGTIKNAAISLEAMFATNVLSTGTPFADTVDPITRDSEKMAYFVASGGVWSLVSNLNGTMTALVAYLNGKRVSVSSIASRGYTASKDTYVDVSDAGVITYTEVANGAASPSLSANNSRQAKVVTSGAAITSIVQSGEDSIGNAIFQVAPGYKQKIFLATGTWTKPAGLKEAVIEVVGGGGSGAGNSATANTGAGGGGGGGFARSRKTAAALGTTETVTVGAGGAGVAAATNGNAGATSSFGAHAVATGGTGGLSAGSGSAGGVGTTGDMIAGGGGGGGGANTGPPTSGAGGNSVLGGGGPGGSGSFVGVAGQAYGGGGSGGCRIAAGGQPGGAGAIGIVIVHEYF